MKPAILNDPDWIDRFDAASLLLITPRELGEKAKEPDGPPHRRFGRRVFYHIPTLQQWFKDSMVRPNPRRKK